MVRNCNPLLRYLIKLSQIFPIPIQIWQRLPNLSCFTLAKSHVKETSKSPGAAAEKAEKVKFSKYEELTKDYHMIPIAIETLGAFGSEGSSFIKNIGPKIQNLTGNKWSTFFLFQSLSMAVQRVNAASILGTVQPGRKLDEIYYLWWYLNLKSNL